MGGRPLTALAIGEFPKEGLDRGVIREIFLGGVAKLREAGAALLGGHTVQDLEIKFGYAVTGAIDPSRILTNAGAKPGDALLLTKALGTGIAVTAIKKEQASPELLRAAVEQMKTLNRAGGEIFAKAYRSVHALTDVTGFGLLGHLDSMMRGSGTRAVLSAASLQILPQVRELAAAGLVPAGSRANLEFVAPRTRFPEGYPEVDRLILADAQTNGGLLAAVAPRQASKLLRALEDSGIVAARIGEVEEGEPGVDVAA